MADSPPLEQKRSIIAKKISGKSGGATPKFESRPEVEDVIKSLPDPIYGTTEHVEPGFWASFVLQYRSEYQHVEWAQTAALRTKKPIRELVLRRHSVETNSFQSCNPKTSHAWPAGNRLQ